MFLGIPQECSFFYEELEVSCKFSLLCLPIPEQKNVSPRSDCGWAKGLIWLSQQHLNSEKHKYYIYIYIYVYLFAYLFIYISCMCIYIYIFVWTCMYVCMYVCMYIYIAQGLVNKGLHQVAIVIPVHLEELILNLADYAYILYPDGSKFLPRT